MTFSVQNPFLFLITFYCLVLGVMDKFSLTLQVIQMACNSRGETLIKAYQIDISRKDIDTLKGLNWLNDEVINFYMNMIVKRSKENDNWPTVRQLKYDVP